MTLTLIKSCQSCSTHCSLIGEMTRPCKKILDTLYGTNVGKHTRWLQIPDACFAPIRVKFVLSSTVNYMDSLQLRKLCSVTWFECAARLGNIFDRVPALSNDGATWFDCQILDCERDPKAHTSPVPRLSDLLKPALIQIRHIYTYQAWRSPVVRLLLPHNSWLRKSIHSRSKACSKRMAGSWCTTQYAGRYSSSPTLCRPWSNAKSQ
jgi:hypothetical protein